MKKIIVVGNGMVGYKVCELIAGHQRYENFEMLVFGEEVRPAYDRVHLSEFFTDKGSQELLMAPRTWYVDHRIDLRTSELIVDIDKEANQVQTHKGTIYDYDFLVLATGSKPFVPRLRGVEKDGVFVYRTIEDLEAIQEYVRKLKKIGKSKAVVMGGGLLGLEAANATKELGLETKVVEYAGRLMPRQLDDAASNTLKTTIEEMGFSLLLNKSTAEIVGDPEIEKLIFDDGEELKTDMLIISAGIRPRDELGKKAGLKVGQRGGIYVDKTMRTSCPDIFAIGEVALYNNMTYGLVAPGYDMARVAVDQIMDGERTMQPTVDMSTQLKLIGTEVASFGDPFAERLGISVITYENKFKNVYKRINISGDGKKLLGGILVGDAGDYNHLFQLYFNNMSLPENPEELIIGARNGEKSSFGSAMELPDGVQICSCESVTKGQICDLVTDKTCSSVRDIAHHTKASTCCGGCKPMVEDLVNEALKFIGAEVNDAVCEHFDYNRQELYDLVKIRQITDFDDALNKIGKGNGCEVCKPVMASIFASVYMETANKQVTIQDSNDRFLANIQRNGTYSVVPRVPGGEITPDKLIVLGEVARKFNLYTKITGGQRIDMFGAELHELPLIWKDLIEAGFESGHAYGKSLRTVKSCVGSTWCRFGLHESVTFAIKIEKRYRGLRSPHKLKGGVSGCIRECAEARGKDFGLIAVDGGWNLYVCGNGGATPKHAILLAEQLDDETAVKYLDRFLMFYIRTAAPLMRTAPWLEKLSGGINYLKDVVVNDSLGIAQELEDEMEQLVNRYECEWKQAIEDPDMMKRFKHFVNSDETDSNISFVPLRDQKMPKPWI